MEEDYQKTQERVPLEEENSKTVDDDKSDKTLLPLEG